PLICDPDGGNIRRLSSCFLHGLHSHPQLIGPYLISVMLYPARFGKILSKFLLGKSDNLSFFIEQNTSVTGSPCIQCHYIFCHVISSSYMLYDYPNLLIFYRCFHFFSI